MNLNSARIAWHDAFYTPWNSGMAEAAERAALGIVEAGGYVRRRITEIDDDGDAVSYSQHTFVPGIHQTRTERDISTPRAVHQALAGVIQKAIDTLAGVVDADYRGELKAVLINHGEEPVQIHVGDRIAQLVVTNCYQSHLVEVEDLDATERGAGAFGSTGLS